MNGLRTYNYRCRAEDCGHVQDRIVRFEERYEPHTCEICGAESTFTVSAPMVLTASYPDGYRKKNDPGWQILAEKSKLKLEAANTVKRKNKKAIKDEIKQLDKRAKK